MSVSNALTCGGGVVQDRPDQLGESFVGRHDPDALAAASTRESSLDLAGARHSAADLGEGDCSTPRRRRRWRGAVVAALGGGHADPANLTGWTSGGLTGIAQAAALLFFAFAGYARIATPGEEVRESARTISLALGIVVAIYAVVGTATLAAVGSTAASSVAPLAAAIQFGTLSRLTLVVRIGGAIACAGVLLLLLAGVGRTVVAMARDHELPHVPQRHRFFQLRDPDLLRHRQRRLVHSAWPPTPVATSAGRARNYRRCGARADPSRWPPC